MAFRQSKWNALTTRRGQSERGLRRSAAALFAGPAARNAELAARGGFDVDVASLAVEPLRVQLRAIALDGNIPELIYAAFATCG